MMKCQCIFVFVAVFVAATYGAVCTQQSLCTCTTDKGLVDLTPLANKILSTNDVQGKEQFKYSPCSNITSPCQDAVVCRSTRMSNKSIGKSEGESFIDTNGTLAIEYPGDDNTSSIVILVCDQSKEAEFTSMGDTGDESFTFQLASRYACVGGPESPGSTTKTTARTTKSTKTTPKKTQTTAKTTTPKSSKTTKTTPKKTTAKTTTPKSSKTIKTSKVSTKTTQKSTAKTTKNTKKTPKTTTPKMQTTTNGVAGSFGSISLGGISIVVLLWRQLF